MIKFLLKLAAVVVVGILSYNFFFGTDEEKEHSREVFNQVKELGKSIGGLIKSEKAKFDEGKYDDAMSKITSAFKNLKSRDEETGGQMSDKLSKLENEKNDLESQLNAAKQGGSKEMSAQEVGALYEKLQGLYKDMQDVSEEMESKETASSH